MTENWLTPPAGGWKDTESTPVEEGVYEAYVSDIERVPNNPAYFDPEKDPPHKKWQYIWTFTIRDEGEFKGRTLKLYSGIAIGRHPRNKLVTRILKFTDPTFDLNVGYPGGEEELFSKNKFKSVRLVTEVVDKEKKMDDGTTKQVQYGKITSLLKSAMPMTGEETLAAMSVTKDDGGHPDLA